jgi:CAAX prenyl protease-like protein
MATSWLEHPALPRVLPFALYIVFLAVGSLEWTFDTRWLYPVQVGLVALALIWFWRRYAELPRLSTLSGGHWSMAFIVGLIVFVLWIHLDTSWMTMGEGGKGFDPRDDGRVNVALALFRIAGAALVVPVMEELFWRSFVMRWIDKPAFLTVSPTAVSLKALMLSSAVFAVEHHLWFAGLIAGLAYGGLYRLTGNLWVPVIAHAVTNGLLGAWVLYTGSWQFW